jgi:hypothetical protein
MNAADAPFIAAAEAQRQQAQDVAASRATVDAIHAISQLDFTPAVAAQIAAVLSNRIEKASWGHWPEALAAMELLDGVHDRLAD